MNTFDLRLDLDKSTVVQVVTIRQGDMVGTTITATIYDHGALADLTGVTVASIEFTLPDGEHYYRSGALISGSTVSVTIDETQAASVPGRACNAYFTLKKGSALYSTASFVIAVLPDATDNATPGESYDDHIQQYVIDWLTEQGAEVTLTVTDGDLDISIT